MLRDPVMCFLGFWGRARLGGGRRPDLAVTLVWNIENPVAEAAAFSASDTRFTQMSVLTVGDDRRC